jgi:hypothetical protein
MKVTIVGRSVFSSNQSANFTTTVTGGTWPYTYKWYKNNQLLNGKTDSTLSVSLSISDLGQSIIRVVVTDKLNKTMEYEKTVRIVNPTSTLNLLSDPGLIVEGNPLVFSTDYYIGTNAPDGENIFTWHVIDGAGNASIVGVGDNSDILTIDPVALTDSGRYYVTISRYDDNDEEVVVATSDEITVSVLSAIFPCSLPEATMDVDGIVTFGPVECDGVAPYTYEWHYINSMSDDIVYGDGETLIVSPGDPAYVNNNKFYVIVTDFLSRTGTSNQVALQLGAACFLAGTPVLTPSGYRPIETIAKGDLVQTADGRNVPVTRTYKKEIGRSNRNTAPFLIPAGSLGPSMPCSDLVMSPGHVVQVSVAEDLWMPAYKCAKASSAVRQIHLGERFTYYNLVLPEYFTDNLVVFNGVVVESMHPRILEFNKEKGAFHRRQKAASS